MPLTLSRITFPVPPFLLVMLQWTPSNARVTWEPAALLVAAAAACDWDLLFFLLLRFFITAIAAAVIPTGTCGQRRCRQQTVCNFIPAMLCICLCCFIQTKQSRICVMPDIVAEQ